MGWPHHLKAIEARQIFSIQATVDCNAVTNASHQEEQLGGCCVWIVVLVNSPNCVVDDVEVKKEFIAQGL